MKNFTYNKRNTRYLPLFLPLILAKIQELFTTHLELWRNRHSQTFQVVGSAKWYNPFSGDWQYLPELYMHLFFVPAFSLLGIYPEDKPTNKSLYNVALLIIAKIRNDLIGHP